MRIGLLGGTFDPIHSGHLHIARLARRRFGLDKIFFIPARSPWQKPDVRADYVDRFAMVALALANQPRWQPLAMPPSRRPSYTIDEVASLQRLYPDAQLMLLAGADAFGGMATWRQPRRLLRACDVIVFAREGHTLEQLAARLPPRAVVSVGRTRIELVGGRVAYWYPRLNHPANSVSIRALLGAGRRPPAGWLPPAVDLYIRRAQLYRKLV